MSENKREKLKITIELPDGNTQVLECHGIAATTLTDEGDKYDCGTVIIGKMCLKDLLALHDNVGDELITTLEKQIIAHTEPKDLLKAVLGVLKGE